MFLVAVVAMLGQLGIEITTLIATLGVGGLAIALALQGTLSNFFAGAYMILDKPIRVGDYIELEGGDKGYVQDIGWRSTKIKMLGDKVVIIPNSKIAESKLINYDQPTRAMSVIISCGVGYNENLEKVEKVTIKVGKNIQKTVDGAVKDFEPFIRYNEFGDSNINFSVILRAKNYVAQYLMKHEFIKQLKKAYDKEGIEISWPVTKVYMAKKKVD